MPVPAPEAARQQPSCLMLSGGETPAELVAWIGVARGSFAVTVAMWPADPAAYVQVRRACARLRVPFIPVPTRAAAGAVIGSRPWNIIEVASPEPALDGGGALIVLGTDDPTLQADALAPFDLVLCSSAAVTQALAEACPGLATLRSGPLGPGDPTGGARRLAIIQEALAERAGRSRRVRGRPTLLQVTPQRFGGARGHVGGGERYVENLCRAVRLADPGMACRVLSCGERNGADGDGSVLLAGDPAVPDSFDPAATDAALHTADVVHVHQCLTRFGLFIAARARMLGCRVIGTDHGGGWAPFLASQPHLARLFDVVQTYSAFGDLAALNLPVSTVRLPGPVDDGAFALAPDAGRDPALVLVLGRVLPHKGVEAVIDALPPSMRLVVAGRQYDADYAAFLVARARGKAVRFAPDLDDTALLALMGQAGLCVQASTTTDYLGRWHPWTELLGLAPLECMCTGMAAIVTRAGALGELGRLPGCHVAGQAAGADLATLLRWHAEGTLPHPAGRAIRDGAVQGYGLRQFGLRYLSLVESLAACAS